MDKITRFKELLKLLKADITKPIRYNWQMRDEVESFLDSINEEDVQLLEPLLDFLYKELKKIEFIREISQGLHLEYDDVFEVEYREELVDDVIIAIGKMNDEKIIDPLIDLFFISEMNRQLLIFEILEKQDVKTIEHLLDRLEVEQDPEIKQAIMFLLDKLGYEEEEEGGGED